jgi:hypothetical protein
MKDIIESTKNFSNQTNKYGESFKVGDYVELTNDGYRTLIMNKNISEFKVSKILYFGEFIDHIAVISEPFLIIHDYTQRISINWLTKSKVHCRKEKLKKLKNYEKRN